MWETIIIMWEAMWNFLLVHPIIVIGIYILLYMTWAYFAAKYDDALGKIEKTIEEDIKKGLFD